MIVDLDDEVTTILQKPLPQLIDKVFVNQDWANLLDENLSKIQADLENAQGTPHTENWDLLHF